MSGTYTIWHKPNCSTSRFVLQALREGGVDPVVRDYIASPPSQDELRAALTLMGIGPRDLLRRKGTPFDELGLGDLSLTDDDLIAAMTRHPILIERPIVFWPKGARIVRPKESVFEMLPAGAGA